MKVEFIALQWFIHDPDKILDIAEGAGHFSAAMEPREDLLLLTHKFKPLTIDFGFYGDETKMDGSWITYVLDTALEQPWKTPVERKTASSFLESLQHIQCFVEKYT